MVLYRGEPKRKAAASKRAVDFKWLDRYSSRTGAGSCCVVSRAIIHQQRRRGQVWAVFGKHCRAVSTLRSKCHVWLSEFLGTGEKEELRSDNQEQEHINCAG